MGGEGGEGDISGEREREREREKMDKILGACKNVEIYLFFLKVFWYQCIHPRMSFTQYSFFMWEGKYLVCPSTGFRRNTKKKAK